MQAKTYMDAGDLVLDELIMGIMKERLAEPDCRQGFILDGFPRTIPQAQALKGLMKELKIRLDFVVSLEVPRDVILDRLTTRRTCANSDCQEIYNIKSNPPLPDGTCRKCGSPTIQRDDETEAAIQHRLETYAKKTSPLIEFYQKEGLLKEFTSLKSKDTVAAIKKQLS